MKATAKVLPIVLLLFCLSLPDIAQARANCTCSPAGNGQEYCSCNDRDGRPYCVRCPIGGPVCIMLNPGPCVPESPQPNAPVVNTPVPGTSPQEDTALRKKQAHDLNEQGVQYYNNKQWKLAADAFKAALEKSPDDQTIRDNYKHAQEYLAAEDAKQKVKQEYKDCSQEQDCINRCQCQYDNGVAGCNNMSNLIEQSNCINKRQKEWFDCRSRGGCE